MGGAEKWDKKGEGGKLEGKTPQLLAYTSNRTAVNAVNLRSCSLIVSQRESRSHQLS